MINIKISTKKLLDLELDAYAFLLEHEFDFANLASVAKKFYSPLEMAVKQRGFSGSAGSSLILNGTDGKRGVSIILIGLGDFKSSTKNVETYRRAMGLLVRIVEKSKLNSIGLTFPDPAIWNLHNRRLAQETSTIIHKAHYHFDEFITNPEKKLSWNSDFYLSISTKIENEVRDGIDRGISIGHAINAARYWCDMPPSSFTPTIFAQEAEKIAKDYNLKYKIFKEKEIIQMGMGGLAAVSRGSEEECRLVILEYKAQKKGRGLQNVPTLAIVGKGITFDSGGLSIKPALAMETMKDDMAGASVVLATMRVIAQFKPLVNVIALAPMSENMPSGSAIKPGDIVKFYNGKTAEVKNTDAEGRLILADALSYAVRNYKLDAIIDVGTLTGACAYFLGPFYAGMVSNNDQLAQKILNAAHCSGDRVWNLPFDEDYRAAITSEVADLSNTESIKYRSGAITAGFFLSNFVDNVPWVHLDTAGVAFGVPDMSYLRPGATGFGIRLLTDVIDHWHEKV